MWNMRWTALHTELTGLPAVSYTHLDVYKRQVYGGNQKVPFAESDFVDHPVSLYAATKRANELMAYTYSYLYKIPATGLRFFTVYGPMGRPDMAYFKFTQSYFAGKPIKIYNNGDFENDLYRDFTYIDAVSYTHLKSKMNWKYEFQKMRRWLRTNYYWQSREWVYKNIKPRIICEKFLKQDDGDELRDYRFFCFNGEPKFIAVDFSITDKTRTRRNLYDLDWKLMCEEISYPKELEIVLKKPEQLGEMIELSRIISSNFPHARIDFYYVNKKIIFGEITFFHQSGVGRIKPSEFENVMGEWSVSYTHLDVYKRQI